jgi:hypothetical protein
MSGVTPEVTSTDGGDASIAHPTARSKVPTAAITLHFLFIGAS